MKSTYIAGKLRRLIDSGQYLPGRRLPSTVGMARTLGASPATVRKALNDLFETGTLCRDENGRYVVAGGAHRPDPVLEMGAEQRSAERVAEQLREDILSGGADRTLPSAKELTSVLGCSHRTLKSALGLLRHMGVVKRHGTGYVTSVPGQRRSSISAVSFVSEQSTLESGSVQTFVMGMERELEALRWGKLRFVIGDGPSGCTLPEEHQVAAYVHYSTHMRSPWWDYLHRPSSVPAVIVNLHEVPSAERARRPNLTMMALDNQRAGRDVATQLASMGHRKCAFFSDLTLTEGCAMLRLRGVQEVFAPEPSRALRTCRVYDTSAVPSEYQPPTTTINAQLREIEEATARQSSLLPATVRHEFAGAFGVVYWWNRYRELEPIFAEALTDTSVTAWVCSHDPMAALAHTFLANAGVAQSGGPALASFDNSASAYALGITSYDFAFDRVGRTAAQCLAAPHLVPTDRNRTVHTAGQLVTRGSSSRRLTGGSPPAAD